MENNNMQELDTESMDSIAGGASYYATDKDFKAYENIANVRRVSPEEGRPNWR